MAYMAAFALSDPKNLGERRKERGAVGSSFLITPLNKPYNEIQYDILNCFKEILFLPQQH